VRRVDRSRPVRVSLPPTVAELQRCVRMLAAGERDKVAALLEPLDEEELVLAVLDMVGQTRAMGLAHQLEDDVYALLGPGPE
jgi:hypothetical protein